MEYENWQPDTSYYMSLLSRLVDRIDQVGSPPDFDPLGLDWRFMEFSNSTNLSLFSTCVELLTLPLRPEVIANHLVSIVINLDSSVPLDSLPKVSFFPDIRLIYKTGGLVQNFRLIFIRNVILR